MCQFCRRNDARSHMYFSNLVANDHLAQQWFPPAESPPMPRCSFVSSCGQTKLEEHRVSPAYWLFRCLNRALKECRWRNNVWNAHTHADTSALCWQCALWVPGSSRGWSRCANIWLLRQIWLIWDGPESSVHQPLWSGLPCTRCQAPNQYS